MIWLVAFVVIGLVVAAFVGLPIGQPLRSALLIDNIPIHNIDDPLTHGYTEAEVRRAALDILSSDGRMPTCSFLGASQDQYDRCVTAIAKRRERYAQHTSPRMRAALLKWLDYEERNNREGFEEWQSRRRHGELARKARA